MATTTATRQHSTAQHSTAQHSTAQHSTAQHSTAQHSKAQHTRPVDDGRARLDLALQGVCQRLYGFGGQAARPYGPTNVGCCAHLSPTLMRCQASARARRMWAAFGVGVWGLGWGLARSCGRVLTAGCRLLWIPDYKAVCTQPLLATKRSQCDLSARRPPANSPPPPNPVPAPSGHTQTMPLPDSSPPPPTPVPASPVALQIQLPTRGSGQISGHWSSVGGAVG